MPSEWEEQRKWLRCSRLKQACKLLIILPKHKANIAKRLGACLLAASYLWFS
jgi:hypothetical protein